MLNYKKEWTIDDLKMDNEAIVAKATGRWCRAWGGKECFDINTSSILTKLIQEAGRWCEFYASDLFISWSSLMEHLNDGNYEGGTYLFGFRSHGVDHLEWVLYRLTEGSESYRSIWRLDVEVSDDEVTMKLGRVR